MWNLQLGHFCSSVHPWESGTAPAPLPSQSGADSDPPPSFGSWPPPPGQCHRLPSSCPHACGGVWCPGLRLPQLPPGLPCSWFRSTGPDWDVLPQEASLSPLSLTGRWPSLLYGTSTFLGNAFQTFPIFCSLVLLNWFSGKCVWMSSWSVISIICE